MIWTGESESEMMRRRLALLLALMLMMAVLTVPAVAYGGGIIGGVDSGIGSSNGGGSDRPAPVGSQKEFTVVAEATEETNEPTWAATEAESVYRAPEEEPEYPATETVVPMATEPDAVATEASMKDEPVKQPPAPAAPKDDGLVQELKDAVKAMKVQMMVILALGLIICMLLLAFVILYARGNLVIKKNPGVQTRLVTMIEKREVPPATVKLQNQEPATVKVENWDMRTVRLPETVKEEDLPPIGQTVILRKPSEQTPPVDWTKKK